jgi:hypothetical protein
VTCGREQSQSEDSARSDATGTGDNEDRAGGKPGEERPSNEVGNPGRHADRAGEIGEDTAKEVSGHGPLHQSGRTDLHQADADTTHQLHGERCGDDRRQAGEQVAGTADREAGDGDGDGRETCDSGDEQREPEEDAEAGRGVQQADPRVTRRKDVSS